MRTSSRSVSLRLARRVISGFAQALEHTDYQNGIDWHVDLMEASRFLTKQLYVGAVGYTFGGGPYPLVPLPGARNIRTLTARFIADMQTHWEKNGMSALDEVRRKFPDRYVDNYVMLARVIRLEADVKHSLATPKTVDEALAELESKVGKEGRRKFEKFLREVGADEEDEDVIDVESK